MSYRFGAAVAAIFVASAGPAFAKTLPAVQLTPANQPAQCLTAGRLMAFLRHRNPRLRSKYRNIAADYIRHGRELGIRWDYAFFQMVVETNSLKYTGDVSYRQNNFAGLGATGGGVKGESFRTVSDGVRAHLQHLMIYAGMYVSNPVADRTRKVQSWGILNKWRAKFRRPVTYGDVGSKWAPHDREYGQDIQAISNAFNASHCNTADPAADQVASRSSRNRLSSNGRNALGAANVARRTNTSNTRYQTINAQKRANARASESARSANKRSKQVAAAAKFAAPSIQPPADVKNCRVWTASYGGQKATIIRSIANATVNYTVLDVNKGREDAETKAYIAAYAKGGRRIGDFPTKSAAMNKAFKLCPKG